MRLQNDPEDIHVKLELCALQNQPMDDCLCIQTLARETGFIKGGIAYIATALPDTPYIFDQCHGVSIGQE